MRDFELQCENLQHTMTMSCQEIQKHLMSQQRVDE
jgi:hypothetical protein